MRSASTRGGDRFADAGLPRYPKLDGLFDTAVAAMIEVDRTVATTTTNETDATTTEPANDTGEAA
jgi:hypothetical protein